MLCFVIINSVLLNLLCGWISTWHVLTSITESPFCNIRNAGVACSTRSLKDIDFCRIKCQIPVQLCVFLLQLPGASRNEQFKRRT